MINDESSSEEEETVKKLLYEYRDIFTDTDHKSW